MIKRNEGETTTCRGVVSQADTRFHTILTILYSSPPPVTRSLLTSGT